MYKFGMRLAVALCFALLFAFSTVEVALAHKPLFKDRDISAPARAMPIPDPTISWAIYANLDHPEEADYFSFQAKTGLSLNVQITIPTIRSLEQFAPHLALLRPGSFAPQDNSVPFAIPSGYTAQLIAASQTGTSDRFDEPFTQTTYWIRQSFQESLPTAGTYYLVVFNRPTDIVQMGKYVLAIGEKEQFGWQDLLTFPSAYFRVRSFAEAGPPLWSWIALILLILVSSIIWWRRNRRKEQSVITDQTESK